MSTTTTHAASGAGEGEKALSARERIKAAAERIVQRWENATPGLLFHCDADRAEAVEIAEEEILALTTGAARG
jgi:hypothetical protein